MASDTSLVFNLVARDRASAALGKMKEKFSQVSTGIGVGVAGALGVGVAAAMDMSSASAKLAAQLGLGPAEAAKTAKVSANVFKAGWGDSAGTVNDAIRGVYQNIGDTSTAQGGIEGVTSKVLALSETFDTDLGGTTAAVGQMMKTGMAKNADEALDIVASGMQHGADKAGDFLDTLNEYGVQFKKFGIDGQMATGLISQGLKAGARDGDLVADSIKEFSIRAIDGSKSTSEGFKAIGLDAGTMATRIGKGGKSASEALDLTLDSLRSMKDPVAQSAAATQLFGTQAEDLGAALFALDPSSAVAALGEVGGSADRMAKTLGDSPAKSLEKFKRTATTKLAEVAGSFVQFGTAHQQFVAPLAIALGGIAATVLVVRGAMMAWTAAQAIWSAATTVATGVQWLLNTALLANPITWIIIGVVALIAVIVLIATKTTWFQTAWKAMTAAVGVAWDWIWGKLQAGWKLLTDLFLNWTGPGLIIKHWGAIKRGTSAAWSAVLGFVKGIPGKIVNFFLNWTLPGLIIKHWGAIKSGTMRVANATVSWVRGLPGRLVGAVATLGSRIGSSASGAFNRFRSAVVRGGNSAISWVKGLPGRVVSALSGIGSKLYNSGRALLRGFVDGIKSMLSAPADAVSAALSKARNLLPFSPAKEGPFSGKGWTLYSGQALVTGLASGITQQAPQAQAAMEGALGITAAAARSPMQTGAGPIGGGPATRRTPAVRLIIDVRGADGDMKRMIRKMVRVDGRGSVQTAFGTS